MDRVLLFLSSHPLTRQALSNFAAERPGILRRDRVPHSGTLTSLEPPPGRRSRRQGAISEADIILLCTSPTKELTTPASLMSPKAVGFLRSKAHGFQDGHGWEARKTPAHSARKAFSMRQVLESHTSCDFFFFMLLLRYEKGLFSSASRNSCPTASKSCGFERYIGQGWAWVR